jgi:hypothetical protein
MRRFQLSTLNNQLSTDFSLDSAAAGPVNHDDLPHHSVCSCRNYQILL